MENMKIVSKEIKPDGSEFIVYLIDTSHGRPIEGFIVKETETLFMDCWKCGWKNETSPYDWEWYDDYPEDKPKDASK